MKSSEYHRSVKPDRNAWRAEQPQTCMVCERTERYVWPGLQVHEILRKSAAPMNWGHRWNYLLVCGECHEGVLSTASHAWQLGVKWLKDRKHFDLVAFCHARNADAPEYVTFEEVMCAVQD